MKTPILASYVAILAGALVSYKGMAQHHSSVRLNEPPQWATTPPDSSGGQSVSFEKSPTTDPWSRTAVITDYTQNFLGSAVSDAELGWTGSLASCLAGTCSVLSQNRTIQRINYYRRLVGLPSNMTFDATRNPDTQAAALIMGANNNLSHSPPTTWLCYSAQGANGANKSNLALGSHSSDAVEQYINDEGTSNRGVGHRRWILFSRATSFGSGNARAANALYGFANALWVFNPTATPASLPAFVAFPPAGFVPRTLIPPRWSFSIPGANFTSATISVSNTAGTSLSVTRHPIESGYGDNTVVWEMNTASDLTWSGSTDRHFTVRVSGVVINGVTQPPYNYTIIAIDPDAPPCTTFESVVNGLWSNPATWSCGRVPQASDRVRVRHLITVPPGTTAVCTGLTYTTGGRIIYGTNARLRMGP